MLKTVHLTIRRFLKETRSDTALEFAMIGTAFFLFIFGIFIISIAQFWQMTLDDTVRSVSRQVEMENITTGSQFVTAVCNEFGIAVPNCATTLQYSVQSNTYFGGITAATLSSTGNLSSNGTFSVTPSTKPQPATTTESAVPGVSEFLLVQVAYPLPFQIPLLPNGVVTENSTPSLYSSVATMMNVPSS